MQNVIGLLLCDCQTERQEIHNHHACCLCQPQALPVTFGMRTWALQLPDDNGRTLLQQLGFDN